MLFLVSVHQQRGETLSPSRRPVAVARGIVIYKALARHLPRATTSQWLPNDNDRLESADPIPLRLVRGSPTPLRRAGAALFRQETVATAKPWTAAAASAALTTAVGNTPDARRSIDPDPTTAQTGTAATLPAYGKQIDPGEMTALGGSSRICGRQEALSGPSSS